MKFLLYLTLILILTITSCGNARKCLPETITVEQTVTKREIIHDTIFKTVPDSSQAKFELVIDAGTGFMKPVPIQSAPGRILNTPKVNIKGNVLTVDCKAEAEQMFAQWKEIYIDSVSKTTIQLPPRFIEKELSTWQRFLIGSAYVFYASIILAIIVFLLIKKIKR